VAAAELTTGGLPELVGQVAVVMLVLGRAKKTDQMELLTQVAVAVVLHTPIKTVAQVAPAL
jgi:hypothetical protein